MFESSRDLERQLHGIWAEVLGHGDFGISDNFSAIGGHSLAASRVVSYIEQRLGSALPLSVFFQNPTVETLAPLLLYPDPETETGRPSMQIPVMEPISLKWE
jgi:acyl carrier protein